MLVELKTLHSVCLLADCLQCKYCYYMLYLLCCPTSKKITLVHIWQIRRPWLFGHQKHFIGSAWNICGVSHCTVLLKTGIDSLVIGQFSIHDVRMCVMCQCRFVVS